jgi:hypothetical protein
VVLLALLSTQFHLACTPPPNPIVQGRRVTLMIESTAGVAPSVTGDFTEWKPLPARRMARCDVGG